LLSTLALQRSRILLEAQERGATVAAHWCAGRVARRGVALLSPQP
jgi:hypothetical protein